MSNLAFGFGIYQEWHLATRLVHQLKKHHPTASAIAIADGTDNSRFRSLCQKVDVTYIKDRRLKLPQYGGSWTLRLFEAFLTLSDADILIKLDPDTMLWRGFSFYPDSDWFGTISPAYRHPFARGGCVGFKRHAVERIVNSEILLNPVFTKPRYSYDRYGKHKHSHECHSTERLSLQDWILADVGYYLDLSLEPWSEVDIQFRDTPDNGDLRYAATHPHV